MTIPETAAITDIATKYSHPKFIKEHHEVQSPKIHKRNRARVEFCATSAIENR
jgi:hypothetical protein